MSDEAAQNARLDAIVDALACFARLDFTARITISDAMDSVDAIATGLNMLAEDLHVAVASRHELERALRELTSAQIKLVHAAKLATVGQLASGVAHEVNNPAGWVSLSVGHAKKRVVDLRRSLDAEAPLADAHAILHDIETLLDGAAEGAERIRAVVGDLRTLARADSDVTELVVLDDVVRAMCTLLAPSTLDHAELRLALGEVPAVRANRGRLGQVLTNLVVNAAQALERAGRRGSIFVSTSVADAAVLLAVDDDGPGVPETLRERVFDPYFTTSPTGTGLGLSLVAEIVARSGGRVRVGTSTHGGARFEVCLPVAVA